MFQSHIDVRLCVSRVGAINYLFEYGCKLTYRNITEMARADQRYNEIGHSQKGRFVSPLEAL